METTVAALSKNRPVSASCTLLIFGRQTVHQHIEITLDRCQVLHGSAGHYLC